MSPEKTEALVKIAISKIESGGLSQAQIMAYVDNVKGNRHTTELQKKSVAEAAERQLRYRNPRAANQIFGMADETARSLLNELLEDTRAEFDLSANCVDTTVKTGGDQRGGKFIVDTYISFKTADGLRSSIEIRQQDALSAPFVVVQMWNVPSDECLARHQLHLSEFDNAAALYKGMLASLLDDV